jgi:hypothetical protein
LAPIRFTITMPRLFNLLILATCILGGCQHDPWASDYAREKPSQTITGTYVPTKYTYSFLHGMYKNVKTSTLELRSDSSFTIRNIAAVWSPFSTAGGFESIKGTWTLNKHQDWWAVALTVESVRDATGHWHQNEFGSQAILVGQHVPYKLHFTIGDPDTNEALQYKLK